MKQLVRHMFTSDYQCPDHNGKILKPLFSFVKDFKPDFFHIVGDFVNFTAVSKYEHDPMYKKDFSQEITACRKLLCALVSVVRQSNPKAVINWYEGNHELRLIKYLIRNAAQLRLLKLNNEEVVSIPHLFQLKKLNINWIPMSEQHWIYNNVLIEHGEMVKRRAGDTAKGMLDLRNCTGLSGHTHRLALTSRTTAKSVDYWMEIGCLCNLQPTPSYIKSPDWQNGFSVGIYDPSKKILHPVLIPILKNSFVFNNKIYS